MLLLVGATGVLGSAVAAQALAVGRPLRVLVRDPGRAAALAARGAALVTGDLGDPASLDRALVGVTHVLTTANAFLATTRQALDAVEIHGNRNLIDAAVRAGVRQFVFTSALLPDEYRSIDYFHAKRRTEEYLGASGLTYTILRPTAFMETWANVVGDPILRTGRARIFGDGRNPVNFVAVEDVAAVAVRALDDPRARNAEVVVAGPENLSLLDVAAVFERIAGRPARKQHMPVPVMHALAFLLRPFNPLLARQIKAGALMATIPQAVDGPASRAGWDVPMTRLEDWARRNP